MSDLDKYTLHGWRCGLREDSGTLTLENMKKAWAQMVNQKPRPPIEIHSPYCAKIQRGDACDCNVSFV